LQALLVQAVISWQQPAYAVEVADGWGWGWDGGGGGGGGGGWGWDGGGGDWGEGRDFDVSPFSQGNDTDPGAAGGSDVEATEAELVNSQEPQDSGEKGDASNSDDGDSTDGHNADGDEGGTDDNGQDEKPQEPKPDPLCGANEVHDPIDLRLADKSHVQVDYLGRGAGPLRLARNYHSNLSVYTAQVTIPMGTGWRSGYDRSVQVLAWNAVRLHRANGRVLEYTWNGSSWVSALPGGVLTQTGSGGWQYVNHRNVVEIYAGNGRLATMSSGGVVTSLQYDGAGRLASVSNSFGRSLSFAYDGAGRVSGVTLPGGSAVAYAYDGYNNLTSVRFADTSVRQYAYENGNFRNALTGVTDESGRRRLTWGYDGNGRPNYGQYGTGTNRVWITYDSGNRIYTTDARGALRTRNYAAVGQRMVLASIQTSATADSPATGWSFSYDGNGHSTQVVSRTGEVRQFSADARGRLLSATRAAGSTVAVAAQASWHPVFRRRVQQVSGGVTQDTSLDSYGRVAQITRTGTNNATLVVEQRTYNAQNLLQSVTDARGSTRSYGYDAAGNVTSITNSLGQTTYLSNYNGHGRVGRVDRPDGTVVLRNFDVRGRMAWRSVNGVATAYAYDSAGRLYQTTNSDGSWRRRNYDSAGYLTSINNHRGETTSIGRDVDGKVNSRIVYAANGTVTQAKYTQYDTRGRVAAVIDSQNNRTQLSYAADGRRSSSTNPLGQTFSQQLDLLDRPTALTQPNTTAMRQAGGPATVSAYLGYNNANATHHSTVDTVSVATGYATDAFNRRVAESGSDAGPKAVVRNAAGDTTAVTDARGITLQVARDSLGRITSITPPAGTGAITYSYVPGRSDALPAQMADPSGSTSWSYDSQGRLLGKTQVTAGSSRSLAITRDSLGRISGMTYPSGMRVDVAYAGDVVSSISVNNKALLNNISYLPMSNVATGWSWGNGSVHSRSFNANGNITAVTLGSAQRSYGYNAAGRIVNYTDTGPQGTRVNTLGYDEAGQLTTYSGPPGSFSYAYDTNGNRRSAVQYGTGGSLNYQAGTNRLLSSPRGSYSYNAAGNPTTDGFLAFTYDAYGQLTKMSTGLDDSTRSFNGQRMRVRTLTRVYESYGPRQTGAPKAPVRLTTTGSVGSSKSGPAQRPIDGGGTWVTVADVRYFHSDDGSLLGEYDSLNSYSQETIWFNGQPVGAMINGVLYYVKSDHLGTPRSITRPGDNAEVWRWDGDPFGNNAPTSPTPGVYVTYNLRMPGQQYESYSGYYYNWMRDYDPYTGRYLQADPLGLYGGLSRYTYVGGNPIGFTDPMGLWLYQQSTGNLYSEGNNPSATTFVGSGYSGAVGYQNNGAIESLGSVGPIPTGNYTIGAQGTYTTNSGKVLTGAMTLTPKPGNWPYGRSGFLIHGDNRRGDRSASEGCVILGPSLRNMIGDSADATFKVVP
jgi:RHS repeat-associated protein